MITPELLRRYPWFAPLDDGQLKAVAMLAEQTAFRPHQTLFESDQPAEALYLLLQGNVDLFHVIAERDEPERRREFFLSDLSAGEVLGISALIEPYRYTLTARAAAPSELVRFNAAALRALCQSDVSLACFLMRQVAAITARRLHETRILLAAARA